MSGNDLNVPIMAQSADSQLILRASGGRIARD
jgi:hypothetical protein